eukprot:gene7132-20762_t
MAKKGAKKAGAKKAAPAAAAPKASIFVPRRRTFGIGGDIPGKRDLGRFVKWPKYVRLQRQHRVLYKRLKVPPAINQFTQTMDKTGATELFRLMDKYRPEDKATKKDRLKAEAVAKTEGKEADKGAKPEVIKYGINHVTALIEKKKTKLVVIAHDVEPIEEIEQVHPSRWGCLVAGSTRVSLHASDSLALVLDLVFDISIVIWLPALCRKMDVPYCIVKGKARLGQVVHKKTATVLAFTDVKKEDQTSFNKLTESIRNNFNERADTFRKTWGGGIMGSKTIHKVAMYEKNRLRELAAREGK